MIAAAERGKAGHSLLHAIAINTRTRGIVLESPRVCSMHAGQGRPAPS